MVRMRPDRQVPQRQKNPRCDGYTQESVHPFHAIEDAAQRLHVHEAGMNFR